VSSVQVKMAFKLRSQWHPNWHCVTLLSSHLVRLTRHTAAHSSLRVGVGPAQLTGRYEQYDSSGHWTSGWIS